MNSVVTMRFTYSNATKLADTIRQSRTLPIAKARSAKLVKSLIDYFGGIPNSESVRPYPFFVQ